MSDEIFLSGKQYVSSKRAAATGGYAQDYVGQLARGGLIDAQRVGGLWYVSMESLEAYKRNADTYAPVPPQGRKVAQELDTIVSFDGKDYVSAAKASKITGYNQDYIGQLARAGKVLSRQIGNRWYIERSGLVAHKSQKDALLAAVQSESVGLVLPEPLNASTGATVHATESREPLLKYMQEDGDLLPNLKKMTETPGMPVVELRGMRTIPIRIASHEREIVRALPPMRPSVTAKKPSRTHGKTMVTATKAVVMLTVVVVLSYGIVSIRSNSVYTANFRINTDIIESSALAASAASTLERVGDLIESWVAPELVYNRDQ